MTVKKILTIGCALILTTQINGCNKNGIDSPSETTGITTNGITTTEAVTEDNSPKSPSQYAPKGQRATGTAPFTDEYLSFTEEDEKAQLKAGYDIMAKVKKAIKEGKKSYTIPAGYYRFDKTFTLSNVEDFELIAEDGVYFIGLSVNYHVLYLKNCKNVTVKGIKLDHSELPFIQCTIVEYVPSASKLIVTIDKGYRSFFEKWRSSWDGSIYRIMYYEKDENENQIPVSAHANGALKGISDVGETDNGEKTYRLLMTDTLHSTLNTGIEVGDKVVIPISKGANTLQLEGCESCTIENVSIYSAGGFAIGDNFGIGRNLFKNVFVGRMPDTDRLIAGSSDGFHSIGDLYGPILDGCEISYTCDDSFNCHTFMAMTVEKVSSSEYIILFPMIANLSRGANLRFFEYTSYHILGEAKVKSVEEITSGNLYNSIQSLRDELISTFKITIRTFDQPKMYRVKLDTEISLDKFTGISCEDYCASGLTIKNCTFHDVNGNGIVLRGYNVTVENNIVTRANSGITISGGGLWSEGPLPQNIIIKGNLFEETNESFEGMIVPGAVSLFVGEYTHTLSDETSLINNVVIEDNEFINTYGTAVSAGNSTNVVVKNNRVFGAMSKAKKTYAVYGDNYFSSLGMPSPMYVFFFYVCDDITVENNYVDGNSGELCKGNFYEWTAEK